VLCVISPWASFVSHASPLPFTISPIGSTDFANVVNALHLRPVPREHRQTPGIVFHLQHRLDASPLQPLLERKRVTWTR
jgi:hypothetical protein